MRTRLPAAAAGLVAITTVPLSGQSRDSLEQRVQRLERLVQILEVQVAEQATTAVASRSRNFVELSGLVLVNAFTNNGRVFMDDVPQFVMGPFADDLPNSGASAGIRQTRLIIDTYVEEVLGAAFVGELDIDFFGGQLPSSGGRTFPLLRLRRTRAELRWRHASLMIGQESPPLAEVSPSSLAAMGFPGFSGAGNLWLWLPQVRARIQTGGTRWIGLEGAILAPTSGTPQPERFYTEPDRAERSRRPFVQGRLVGGWGDEDTGGTVSLAGHYGWFAAPDDVLLVSKAAAVSARFAVTSYAEVRGEAFIGQGLRALGGGGVYQNFTSDGRMLESRGGWAQLNLRPAPAWEIGGGYGVDDPDDDAFDAGMGRRKNTSVEVHVQWRPAPLLFGVEFRRLETTHGDTALGTLTNNHVNLAIGFEF